MCVTGYCRNGADGDECETDADCPASTNKRCNRDIQDPLAKGIGDAVGLALGKWTDNVGTSGSCTGTDPHCTSRFSDQKLMTAHDQAITYTSVASTIDGAAGGTYRATTTIFGAGPVGGAIFAERLGHGIGAATLIASVVSTANGEDVHPASVTSGALFGALWLVKTAFIPPPYNLMVALGGMAIGTFVNWIAGLIRSSRCE